MLNRSWKKWIAQVMVCLMTLLVVFPLVSCKESEPQSTYTFVYDTNYQGGNKRTVQVGAGKTASNWSVSRAGYVLDGWFYESGCVNQYNFSTPVNEDTTVYALWTSRSEIVYSAVTFDYGDGLVKTQDCRQGKPIANTSVMKSQKLGYEIEGWYLDNEYTDEFVLDEDIVQGAITLYAKYEKMDGVAYTEDGDFIFDGVEIRVKFQDSHSMSEKGAIVIEEFNRAYEGQIKAYIAGKDEGGTLVYDQTEKLNTASQNYFPMEDALALAGKALNEDEYYRNQINDSYIGDKLYTMPIGSWVPAIVYNRSLMKKYNGDGQSEGTLPSSYTEIMALLNKVENGEGTREDWQGTLTMSSTWDMMEISSNNFYIQNGLPLYELGNDGRCSNQWEKDNATLAKMLAATKRFYDTYVKAGSIGKLTGTDLWGSSKKGTRWKYVGTGQSFMAVMGTCSTQRICGYSVNQSEKTLYEKTLGVMPISHLFASQGDEESSQKIFVKNFSLAIPKYSKNDMKQVAAAAVFADFMSKYSEPMTQSYLYPANKLAQENMFNQTRAFWAVDYMFAYCGEPENFFTYPGGAFEYNVINTVHSQFLTNRLYWLDNPTDEQLLAEIATLCENINTEIGV